MAFQLFESRPTMTSGSVISIKPTGAMYLNAEATKHLKTQKAVGVLVYWDKAELQMALVPTSFAKATMFTLRFTPSGKGASFSPRAFAKHIGWKASAPVLLPANWDANKGRFVIDLPSEYVTSADPSARIRQSLRLKAQKRLEDLIEKREIT